MGKRGKSSSLKFVCAISMSMFSLIALFMGTVAWFTSVKVTRNGADDFNVENKSLMIKSVSVFNQFSDTTPYVFKETPAVVYSINGDNMSVQTNNEPISIRAYSSLSEHPDSTLLYLFEVDSNRANTPEDGFSIKTKTLTTDSANAGANNTNGCLVYKDAEGDVAHQLVYDVDSETMQEMLNDNPDLDESYFGHNSMSSVISFDAKGLSTFTASNSKYDLSSDFASATSSSFVHDIESDSNGDITYEYTQNLNIFTRESNDQETCPKYVAVVCHYNPLSLQYIFNINLGNPVADSELVIFTCDWYFEIR